MQYLCLCHYDAAQFATLDPADFEAIGAICAPHDRALKESGHLIAVGALAMPEHSPDVAGRCGRRDDQRRPYAESRASRSAPSS